MREPRPGGGQGDRGTVSRGALSGPVVLVLAILRWIIMKIF